MTVALPKEPAGGCWRPVLVLSSGTEDAKREAVMAIERIGRLCESMR